MDRTISALFERALEDEPLPPPGDPAREAMAQGSRLRRHRRLLGGGAVAAGVAAVVFAVLAVLPGSQVGDTPAAAAGWCGVSVFMTEDATEADLLAVQHALTAGTLVRDVRFESREEAYQRFRELWRDEPDFMKSVSPGSLPQSFRVRLKDSTQYPALAAGLSTLEGVDDVVVDPSCPAAEPREGK